MKFELTDRELQRAIAFQRRQDEVVYEQQKNNADPFIQSMISTGQPYYGAIGGGLTYSFTPNSIGVSVTVSHNVTGVEEDITDYNLW